MTSEHKFDKFITSLTFLSEFLLGETILVAPILKEGARERDIYLPAGIWEEPNGTSHTGNQWIRGYPAPLGTIPYFTLQTNDQNEL